MFVIPGDELVIVNLLDDLNWDASIYEEVELCHTPAPLITVRYVLSTQMDF